MKNFIKVETHFYSTFNTKVGHDNLKTRTGKITQPTDLKGRK